MWETKEKYWSAYIGGVGDSVRIYLVWKYTPLYEKGIKKDQSKSMETTNNCCNYICNNLEKGTKIKYARMRPIGTMNQCRLPWKRDLTQKKLKKTPTFLPNFFADGQKSRSKNQRSNALTRTPKKNNMITVVSCVLISV